MIFTDECVSHDSIHANPNVYSDFFTLPDMVRRLPILFAKGKMLFGGNQDSSDLVVEAAGLLVDAKQEYEKLSEWPFEQPRRRPCQSYPLHKRVDHGIGPVYPSRIDIYCDTTQATLCNSWSLAQVYVLTIIAKVAALLEPFTSCHTDALFLLAEKESAEDRIGEHIDDLCSSIPYITSPNDIEAVAAHYPHGPDSPYVSKNLSLDTIAGMSQLKETLVVGSQTYCIPHSQKQWMQQYLTLLSKDRRADQIKALRLELT